MSSDDETLSLYRAYIRRLSDLVIKAKQGDARAIMGLKTSTPEEVKEAEALTHYLFRDEEPETGGGCLNVTPRFMRWLIAFALLGAAPAFPADGAKFWKWSLVTLAAANTADAVTSLRNDNTPGLRESNPLYGNQFGSRGIAIKSALVGGQALGQWLILRHHPRAARWFAFGNCAQSGAPAWAAWHNGQLK